MNDNLPFAASLFVVIALIFLNAFFVAAQFSILNSHSTKMKMANGKKSRRERAAIWLIGKLDLSLSATQLGITTTSLLLGWYAITIFSQWFIGLFSYLGVSSSEYFAIPLALVLACVVIVFFHTILGELVAKSLAIRYPEQTLQLLSGTIVFFTQITRPVLFLITGGANLLLRLFKTSIPAKSERFHSVSELSLLVSQSTESGVIDKDEEKMLRGVFGFSDTVAREVMTPRTDLVAVDVAATFAEIIDSIVETGLSRFPVKDGEIDNILGVLLAKDVLAFVPEVGSSRTDNFSVRRIMREPYFIPGTKPVDDLLNEFKHRKIHMAIVLDEHGGVDGVVTLEDVIEEIVGDIFDESDVSEQAIVVEQNGDVIVDGGTLVSDLNERFSLTIPEGDYDTIAGFVFSSLGRMTKVGDQILISGSGMVQVNGPAPMSVLERASGDNAEHGNAHSSGGLDDEAVADPPNALITVEKVESHRIESVRLKQFEYGEDPETDSSEPASQEKGIVSDGDV